MVGLHLDSAKPRRYGEAVAPEDLPLRDAVYVAHESPGIVCESIVTLLELVQFLDYGNRYHQVIVLEFAYSLVVVQYNVCIQHEDFRFSHISIERYYRLSVLAFSILHQGFQYGFYPGFAG